MGPVRTRANKRSTVVQLYDRLNQKALQAVSQASKADITTIKILDIINKYNHAWKSIASEFKRKFQKSNSEVKRLTSSESHLKVLLEEEVSRRRRAEASRNQLKKKIETIKEVLQTNDMEQARRHLDDFNISAITASCGRCDHSAGSLLDPANISVESDQGDGLLGKRKSDKSDELYFGIDLKRGLLDIPICKDTAYVNPVTEDSPSGQSFTPSDVGLSTDDAKITPHSKVINRLNRPHNFVPRTLSRMELCNSCGKRIAFGKPSIRCTVCRLVVHPSCKNQLIQTCIPLPTSAKPQRHDSRSILSPSRTRKNTPESSLVSRTPTIFRHGAIPPSPIVNSPTLPVRLGSRAMKLADFCPADQKPCIPALIIHCANEVLARGMNVVGIYRVSGSEKQVRELFDKFMRNKVTPGLALIEDLHVVCGCLKLFLRNLSEPLVTFEQRPVLAAASEKAELNIDQATEDVLRVLDALPAPNRHTLCFMMLHLKSVARQPFCQMGEENLIRVFGPTLVGYSCPEPQVMQTLNETRTQQSILKLLFTVPGHIYSGILSNLDSDSESAVEPERMAPVVFEAPNAQRIGRRGGLGHSVRKRFFPNFRSPYRESRTD